MLYRRSNQGSVVNANNCEEIMKYINGCLKIKFNLDDLPNSKPVMGVDDLLLGLTYHWSRDKSIFPTEDDRLDLSTIMLFQAYTACRPAELVDGTKSKVGIDPLLDGIPVEDFDGAISSIMDQTSHDNDKSKSEAESDSYTEIHDAAYNDTDTDSDDPGNGKYREDLDDNVCRGGSEDSTTISKTALSEFEDDLELVRKYKALCYEDIVLWIVKNPKDGERDVLAMEVVFRHHKGVDKKPKPENFSRQILSG